MIRFVKLADAKAISDIYNHFIKYTVATFEEKTVSIKETERRIRQQQSSGLPWFVLENESGTVVGYAYGNQWKGRSAYRFSVEATVYLDPNVVGKGYGSVLYTALINALKEQGIHVVLGVISLPNEASVALHEKFGMKKVAHFSEVGYKFNEWVDVGYWQIVLPQDKTS